MEIPNFIPLEIDALLKNYVKNTERNIKSGTANEESFYSDFKVFLEGLFPPKQGYFIQITPKVHHSSNRPDFIISYNGIVLFYIEAKNPNTIEPLLSQHDAHLEDQIQRYTQDGVQLILTDFLNLYMVDPQKNGLNTEIQFKCKIIDVSESHFSISKSKNSAKLKPAANVQSDLKFLLNKTCEDCFKSISNVQKLIIPLSQIAQELNKKSKFLLTNPNSQLSPIQQKAAQYLKQILSDFRKSIFKEEIKDEKELFSDLFAQTIVYGAFSAWLKFCQKGNYSQEFHLNIIGDYLPYGSFLRDLFLNLHNHAPKEFKPVLDSMESMFQKTEFRAMQNSETLITTFYSDFLKEYDPITAKERGVVYTPHEIVNFMVRGIDSLLKKHLNLPKGIITENTTQSERLNILDPAAGTMAFASGLIHHAKELLYDEYGQPALARAAFERWVKTSFFPNTFAFEILMAPYVLGHIRIFLTLDELGMKLSTEEYRLNSYLMNTLMSPPTTTMDKWVFNNQEIASEIKQALDIRDNKEIFVVLGNPPYNLSSQNNSDWINSQIQTYKEGLNEKNLKILSDDYVKFIRFAQWKIEKVGKGILAFITNSKYLDGQMFSIMRQSLRNTFDHIYIVNLHGDMRKKETGNVFDIRVGVAIAFMVRENDLPNKNAQIHYLDIPHSTREEKLNALAQTFDPALFVPLPETKKNYFVKFDVSLLNHYESFIPINKFFIKTPTSGIMVGRDHLLVDTDKCNVEWNIDRFFQKDFESLNQLKITTNDTKTWQKESVFTKTNADEVKSSIRMMQYRGFDVRYLAYNRDIVEGHRMGYIDQISPDNLAITVSKFSRKKRFNTAFITKRIVEKCSMAVTDTSYTFLQNYGGNSNLKIPKNLSYNISSETLFFYLYGILFTPCYRKRYNEYLLKSFPGIPLTKNKTLFEKMSEKGRILSQNHLLEISISSHISLSDNNPQDWKVLDFEYQKSAQKLFFASPTQENVPWVEGITQEMWNFEIGGKKQLEQYLKSRTYSQTRKWNTLQRALNFEELEYFLKICTAIKNTIEILPELDEIYKKIDQID